MHNTYFSSTIYAVRNKGSFSLSFNDYSNCLYERLDRTPSRLSSSSSCCRCCDCCVISNYRVPITPSLLCGLRQSSLLQWSSSRRLILSGGERHFYRLPVYSSNRYCELNCFVKERNVCDGRRINGRCFCTVSEEESEISDSGRYDEAEAVLSLLSEEASGDFVGVRGKNVSSFKRLGVEEKRIVGSRERNLRSRKKVVVEKKGNLKNQKTLTVDWRKDNEEHNKEKEAFMKGENRWKRRDASSCLSYYSLSSSGDFESDMEVQDKHGQNEEELSVGYEENKTSHLEGQVMEEYNKQREDSEKLVEISNQERTRLGSDIDWNIRKKTEKRLTEVSMDKTESTKEYQNMISRVFGMHDSNSGKASVSHKQFDSEQANSSSAMGLNKKTEKENIQDTDRTSEFQWMKQQQQLPKREKIISQVEERRKSQQISELSQFHESDVELEDTSILKSRTRVKNWKENSNLGSDVSGLHVQTDKRTQQSSQPGKGSDSSELVYPVSETGVSNEKKFSSSQRTSGYVRFSQKSNMKSGVKTRDSYCQTDERITQSSSEAQRPTNLSISTETDSRASASFHGSSNLISEAREQHVILEGGDIRISQLLPIPSSSQLTARGSAHVEPTTGIATPDVYPETSESASSALYNNSGRSSALLSEPYSGEASDLVYSAPSHITSPEDALGSAYRLEKASEQFVDEFVEKVRHEVTTSETQDLEVTGANSASDQMDSLRHGTQNGSQLKEHESNRSSEFSGTKGPSDEMWDETEPSVRQSLTTEASDDSKPTREPIVTRTGRSLWSIMGDIVRLRWGSHSNASTSASRSGERRSSNKFDSETQLPGQEAEETSKSNVGQERTSVQQQATISDQLETGKLLTQSEGEVVDTMKLKDKAKHLEVGMSSSPHILESGLTSIGMSFTPKEENTSRTELTSIGMSFASEEENTSRIEDGKNLQGTASGVVTMELSNPLPFSGPPFFEEIVNTSSSDMLTTKSVMPTEEPIAPMQAESPGTRRKDGDLKQRKLQWNKQVLRNRFDEWEEAYKLEQEQQKIDEVFMREALLEAKKGADIWEVPVGAVLVQHGKIIARGCNLVEELRDSTAHAEMICIREASNLLRSWRLADTTLYVTLEPCPMCAGAILQARVETLVWGAPNKLLGADGSWVRLFPDGGNSSELKDRSAAPVHPFHPNMNIRRGVLATECADNGCSNVVAVHSCLSPLLSSPNQWSGTSSIANYNSCCPIQPANYNGCSPVQPATTTAVAPSHLPTTTAAAPANLPTTTAAGPSKLPTTTPAAPSKLPTANPPSSGTPVAAKAPVVTATSPTSGKPPTATQPPPNVARTPNSAPVKSPIPKSAQAPIVAATSPTSGKSPAVTQPPTNVARTPSSAPVKSPIPKSAQAPIVAATSPTSGKPPIATQPPTDAAITPSSAPVKSPTLKPAPVKSPKPSPKVTPASSPKVQPPQIPPPLPPQSPPASVPTLPPPVDSPPLLPPPKVAPTPVQTPPAPAPIKETPESAPAPARKAKKAPVPSPSDTPPALAPAPARKPKKAPVPSPADAPPALAPAPVAETPAPAPETEEPTPPPPKHKKRKHKHKHKKVRHPQQDLDAPAPAPAPTVRIRTHSPPAPLTDTSITDTSTTDDTPAPAPILDVSGAPSYHQQGKMSGIWATGLAIAILLAINGYSS